MNNSTSDQYKVLAMMHAWSELNLDRMSYEQLQYYYWSLYYGIKYVSSDETL